MTRRKRCAFLTMENPEGFVCHDHLTFQPLANQGWSVDNIPWNLPDVSWGDFDLVVIRSSWDYQQDPQRFIRALEDIDRSSSTLVNPLDIVLWNLDKSYLRDLQSQGISIVPTLWLAGLEQFNLDSAFEFFSTDELVVKPTVGANAVDTFRLARDGSPNAARKALAAFQSRPSMLQPFVKAVRVHGEYSLFYFGGEYSHCVLKTPKQGDFRVQEEHGGIIRVCDANQVLREVCERVLTTIGRRLLYARIDIVFLSHDEPAVIEVELIEPSLYFDYDERSPVRFAEVLDAMFHE